MSTLSTPPSDDPNGTESDRQMLLIAYVLHAITPFNGVSAIAAVIISHLKVNETQSAFIRSHHRWLIRTFWWGLFWSVVCWGLTLILIGIAGLFVLAIWWLYRTIRGFIHYSERRPMPV